MTELRVSVPPLFIPKPDGQALLLLLRAPVGTPVRDRDGDVWVRLCEHHDDGMVWKRRGGGLATPAEVAHWAPLVELAFDPGEPEVQS
ncbi:hypothetical protein [Nocardia aurea]|uniref:hypothetical protein n=1 Tax=Nocardia aurea TaxID=2144174 RepID=UPI0033A9E4E1